MLRDVISVARKELILASPYIKKAEADWVCGELNQTKARVAVQILTHVRTDSVLSGSLDLDALITFSNNLRHATVLNLPRLHAKVYLADTRQAFVTSANLTTPGLDGNFECGIAIDEQSIVNELKISLNSYARVGNILTLETLRELCVTANELAREFQHVQRAAGSKLRRRFSEKLRSANYQFLKAQVGVRSAHSLFSEAILYALSTTPLTTAELHPRIQRMLPDLCRDDVELIINGERFGKKWKHAVRNAQQYLKRTGQIQFDGKRWSLSGS
jgi:phosphatidylserine/phosphatidylglycerophosphate/cardiolipin synthase-like enzyme